MLLFGYNFGFWNLHEGYPKNSRPIDHINHEEKPLCNNLDIENKVFTYTRIVVPEKFDEYICEDCMKIYLVKIDVTVPEELLIVRLGL
ncbi:hypothetical protein LCGC14_0911500 [marine sediment metagenome]|uniref:Uncharacterized protein n=1 Tax=marine sediment metagenome TaxID=412755 RepID=A0A0F9S0D2_9ZZZZ